ncbi:MAG: hypothetical protein HGA67_03825 [Candidatus Yonathbacteria bacterium]|nr:hypothetical protein [Candidatus Yonathbacteria bacterium]
MKGIKNVGIPYASDWLAFGRYEQVNNSPMCTHTPASGGVRPLPSHAPKNAVFGRFTGRFSFLGGGVWEWADAEGRSLQRSNYVPANLVGEHTKPGKIVLPGEQVILPEYIRAWRFRELLDCGHVQIDELTALFKALERRGVKVIVDHGRIRFGDSGTAVDVVDADDEARKRYGASIDGGLLLHKKELMLMYAALSRLGVKISTFGKKYFLSNA